MFNQDNEDLRVLFLMMVMFVLTVIACTQSFVSPELVQSVISKGSEK
jgi:hypothetical protein